MICQEDFEKYFLPAEKERTGYCGYVRVGSEGDIGYEIIGEYCFPEKVWNIGNRKNRTGSGAGNGSEAPKNV